MLTFSNLASGIYRRCIYRRCIYIEDVCHPCVLEKLKMGESNSLQGRSKLDNWWGADIRIFMFTHHKSN